MQKVYLEGIHMSDKTQPCGHAQSDIVSSDEGTSYCSACEQLAAREKHPMEACRNPLVENKELIRENQQLREQLAALRLNKQLSNQLDRSKHNRRPRPSV
jgi:hypothetical protein